MIYLKTLLSAAAFVLVLVILQTACNQKQELDDKTKSELIDRGSAVTQKLGAALMEQLSAQIQENGVAEAIKFCSLEAIPITDSISEAEGVKISRVSHRNRNPQNAANEQELKIIEKYLASIESAEPIDPVVISEEQQYIYYSPILISMPTCLKCHGEPKENIPVEVSPVLKENYPNDKATGFKMGELRGLFKVEFNEDQVK